MKTKAMSPKVAFGLAFMAVLGLGVCSIAAIALFAPAVPTLTSWGSMVEIISQGTCPVALVAGLVAFFWARNARAQ